MNNTMHQIRASLNGAARPALTGVVVATGIAALLVLEIKAARFAFATAPQGDDVSPWLYAAISIFCGVVAFALSIVASMLKHDERKHVARQAFTVRLIALVSLLVPIWSLAGAFAYDRQVKEHEVYLASPVFKADQETLADPTATLQERRNARARMQPPGTAERGFGDVAGAMFLHLLVMQWAGAARLPSRITEDERKAMREAEARARKNALARERRKAKAKAKAKEAKGTVIPFLKGANLK